MNPEPENPYTASESDPMPENGALWRMRHRTLLVRDGAGLPEIDLYSGAEGPLVRMQRRVPVHSTIPVVMQVVLLAGALGFRLQATSGGTPPYGIFAGLMALFWVITRFTERRVTLTYWLDAGELKRRRFQNLAGWLLVVASLVLLGKQLLGPGPGGMEQWVRDSDTRHMAVGAVALLFGLIALKTRAPHPLTCVKSDDGWYQVAGVPRVVLLRLRRISRDS